MVMTKAPRLHLASTLALVLVFICAVANGPEHQEKRVLACRDLVSPAFTRHCHVPRFIISLRAGRRIVQCP